MKEKTKRVCVMIVNERWQNGKIDERERGCEKKTA